MDSYRRQLESGGCRRCVQDSREGSRRGTCKYRVIALKKLFYADALSLQGSYKGIGLSSMS